MCIQYLNCLSQICSVESIPLRDKRFHTTHYCTCFCITMMTAGQQCDDNSKNNFPKITNWKKKHSQVLTSVLTMPRNLSYQVEFHFYKYFFFSFDRYRITAGIRVTIADIARLPKSARTIIHVISTHFYIIFVSEYVTSHDRLFVYIILYVHIYRHRIIMYLSVSSSYIV